MKNRLQFLRLIALLFLFTLPGFLPKAASNNPLPSPGMILAIPEAGFTSDITGGCAPIEVQFSNTSSPEATDFLWEFPGGIPSSSTDPNPIVTYEFGGVFEVTLIASNSEGSDTLTQLAYITAIDPPTAEASNSGPYCTGDQIFLFANEVAGAAYAWAGPNGYASSEQNPEDATEAGLYTLIISANGCDSEEASTEVVISDPPTADAGFDNQVCDLIAQLEAQPSIGIGAWTQGSGPGVATFTDPSDPATEVTVSEGGTYTFIWTENNNGCESADDVEVSFTAIPVAEPSNGGPYCAGDQIFLFANEVAGGIYFWSGPDGYTSTEQNPADATEGGLYTLVITVNDCNSDDAITEVILEETPVANAGDDAQVCGLDAQLAAQPSSGTGAWTQSGGPGLSTFSDPNDPESSVAVSEAGTYTFIWTESLNNCESSDEVEITFTPAPVAEPSNSGPYCEEDQIFLFANDIAGASYSWTGPNGYVSSEQNPENATEAGTYTLVVTVDGCSSEEQSTEVEIGTAPTGSFDVQVNGNTATFSADATGADSFAWSFGDGEFSTEPNPVHVYGPDGIYTVELIISNECGSLVLNGTVEIVTPPQAGFSSDLDSGCVPFTVSFTSQSSANVTSWLWTFPGGTPSSSTEENPVVTYNAPGSYDVKLEVSNSQFSDVVEIQDFITVDPLPEAAFTAESDNLEATFENASSNAGEYLWLFGDGQTSTEVNPSHTYSSPGTYTVTLIAINECGSDTTTQELDIIVSTRDRDLLSFVRVFPNPGTGLYQMEVTGMPGSALEINLFDLYGKRLFSESTEVQGGELYKTLDFRTLSPATYLLHLKSGESVRIVRLVIQ